jgi:transcriptional regulator with XRE-family HTH domain
MTQRLQTTSPRHAAAVAFGALLDRRMREREVGQHNLRDAAGVSRSAIVEYRHGRNLPSLEVALRLAEALDEPRLAEIVRQGRTLACRRCGRPFLNEAAFPKRYCSPGCRLLGAPSLDGERRSHGEEAVGLLRGEFLRMGAVRKQQVGRALTLLDDALKPVRDAEQALSAYQDAVAAMCAACEPEGLCRTAACPLRGISPLPLANAPGIEVQTAVKKPGAIARWAQPGAREAFSEALRRRWAEPGRKEEQSERSRAHWAGLTAEQRAAVGAKNSAAQRAQPELVGGAATWDDVIAC